MRVCYLADAPYVHTRRWVEHFVGLGCEAHVISFRPAEIDGAVVHYIDGWERLGKVRYLLHAPRVRRLVRSLQPDLLHALHLTSYGFLAGLCGVHPSIVSVWGTDVLEAPRLSPFHYLITRYALARADHITATGMRLAEATLRYAPRGKPVTVVPYGIDLARFSPRPRERAEQVVVGAVARLSPEKGLEFLLRAVAALVEQGRPLRVVLAGDGPQRGRLERLAARLGLAERVEFLGEVPHGDVPAVLQRLDIFAMPSLAEGFGVAALEAAAMEIPVVASRVHGIPDVVADGQSGLLVPPRDPSALARAMARLADDADLRQRLGRGGRALVEARYRWQDNAAQMERLYQALAGPFTKGQPRATLL